MKYEQPIMEIIEFKMDNIVITSLTGNEGGTDKTYDPVNDPTLGW